MTEPNRFFAQWGYRLQEADLARPRPNPTFSNPPWESAPLRLLILRLSPYRDVDRSTPHLFLAQAARRAEPQAYLDFCFFPTAADKRLLEASGVPLITGIESGRSFADFDLVLASCSYHLELLNLPYLLLGSGAPLWAGERGQAWPPLILGGSSALASQALIAESGDCLADGLFFGEGEGQAEELILRLGRSRERPKRQRLEDAAEIEGFWPSGSLDRPVRQAVCRRPQARLAAFPYPILSGPEAGTARLPIDYGCAFRCSFCFEGHERRPHRTLAAAPLLEAAEALKRSSGAETLELASFNVNAHPELPCLLAGLNRLFLQVHFMSQRADILEASPGLLELELAAGKRGFTLGIEGVSERQRSFLQKRLDEAAVRRLLDRLLEARVREVKLFYLLTGYENEADFEEFRSFLGWLSGRLQRRGVGTRLIFSFNRLMRMPFTPLRYDRLFLEPERWRPLLAQARRAVEGSGGGEFRLASSWPEYAVAQVLVMGGYWLHEPLRLLAEKGFCYDGGLEPAAWRLLNDWLADRPELYAALTEEKPKEYRFPFGFVRTPVPGPVLYRNYLRARVALEPRSERLHSAHASARSGPNVPPQAEGELRRLLSAKQRLRPVLVRLRLPPAVAGASPEWLNAWLMRELLRSRPELAANLLSAREILFSSRDPRRRWPPWYGRTLAALTAWDPQAALSGLQSPPAADLQPLLELEAFWGPDAPAPSGYRRLELHLELPERLFPGAAARLSEYLAACHAPATLRRDAEGFRFEPAEKARRKGVLLAGRSQTEAEIVEMRLTVGPRFQPRAFLARFPDTDAWREALIEVLDFEPA